MQGKQGKTMSFWCDMECDMGVTCSATWIF